MKLHILGICGTFMGGLAALAREAGIEVSGSDQHVYPPMSTQLRELGIELNEGYDPAHLQPPPDLVVIGNALSRGNPAVEYTLNQRLPYTSGPRWLGENYLKGRAVVAIAGTHGKTTTSAMVAWILQHAGHDPGFLIGGVPGNFGISARGGSGPFVVEADEYDTAFFDKRAKFVHYRPQVAVLNNLEFDHADIYPDISAIQTQFHHLIRTIPGAGLIVCNGQDARLDEVLEQGCWSRLQTFGESQNEAWRYELAQPDGSVVRLFHEQRELATLTWNLCGRHNACNALAAIAACHDLGVEPALAVEALSQFRGVKRRLEQLVSLGGVTAYDDFAHHPTAIRVTLDGLRRKVRNARLWVALEPRSNTMRAGHHKNELVSSLAAADQVLLYAGSGIDWDPQELVTRLDGRGRSFARSDDLLPHLLTHLRDGDHLVFMSNGAFDGLPQRFVEAWKAKHGRA
ncbi:MAG: UDP-N-acetylmuramate:L-alanyl-gamma-D-glutamyl-me so-diaminopimelate ligase [Wenzhouxiangellaceae bacterium]